MFLRIGTRGSSRGAAGSRGLRGWIRMLMLGCGACVPSAGLANAEGRAFEVEGAWFVVAHFTDSSTNNPDSTRWVDEVWTFEKKGSRLSWTKYPYVIFDDTSGRFETLGRNPRSRVLAGWEPNEGQLQQILKGPRVNSRGSKTKSLRGSNGKGWKSASRMQVASATTVGYQENWAISNLTGGLPLFSREDMIGIGASGQAEGSTTFQVTSLTPRPSGLYQRDGIKQGTFFMIRTRTPRGLAKKDGTVNERFNERARKEALRQFQEEQRRQAGEEDAE